MIGKVLMIERRELENESERKGFLFCGIWLRNIN